MTAPTHRVLLVDRDIFALGVLGRALASRGIGAVLATTSVMACDLVVSGFDAVISTRRMVEDAGAGLGLVDAMALDVPLPPPLILRGDDLATVVVDDLVQTISSLPTSPPTVEARSFALSRVRLLSVLSLLGAARATGTLTVHGDLGAGEIRFAAGRMVAACYLRLEARKALLRMAEVETGQAAWVPGEIALVSHMDLDGSSVETELARDLAESFELRAEFEKDEKNALLMGDGGAPEGATPAALAVARRLKRPATVAEVLDDVPFVDAEVLRALIDLERAAKIRRMGEKARAQVVPHERLAELKAIASRLKAPGFSSDARIVFAATPAHLDALSYAVGGIEDAFLTQRPAPQIPVPHLLAHVRLGDGVQVEIVTLPLVPVYAPMWSMTLAGSALVVSLDDASAPLLAAIARDAEVGVMAARDLIDDDPLEITAGSVARMIRAALSPR